MTLVLALLNAVLLAVVFRQGFLLHERRDGAETAGTVAAHIADGSSSNSSSANRASDTDPAEDDLGAASLRGDYSVAPSQLTGSDTEPPQPQFDWEQVESENYRTYIDNLRSIGCPEQTVSDIIVADVMGAFAAKRAEVMADNLQGFHYWKADADEVAIRGELERQQHEVDEWMDSVLRELLGLDASSPPTASEWRQAALAEQLSFLPTQTRDGVLDILADYTEVDAGIRAIASSRRAQAPENPDERLRMVADYERKREALRTLLTPEEYELVDMTTSWTADNLRRAMTKFEPSEEEFRAIFREWRAHDENLAVRYATGEPDPGNAHVFEAISEALTPERYALYRETWWK